MFRNTKDKGLSRRLERLENILAVKVSQTTVRYETSAEDGQGTTAADSPAFLGTSAGRLCDQSPEVETSIGTFGKLHFAGHQLGEISSCHGVPLFSPDGRKWIQSRTGQNASFPRLGVPLWHNQQHRHDTISSPASNLDLPDRKLTEEYLSLFCSAAISHVFPVVDVELFSQTIAAAYEPFGARSAGIHARAKACVFSFLAIVSIMVPAAEAIPVDSDACALKAQYLLPHILIDASLDALQVAMMQVSMPELRLTKAEAYNNKPVYFQPFFWEFPNGVRVSFIGVPNAVHAWWP